MVFAIAAAIGLGEGRAQASGSFGYAQGKSAAAPRAESGRRSRPIKIAPVEGDAGYIFPDEEPKSSKSDSYQRLIGEVAGGGQDQVQVKKDLDQIFDNVFTEAAKEAFVRSVGASIGRSRWIHKLPDSEPGASLYAFTFGYGDCPAGCIGNHQIVVKVYSDGRKPEIVEGGNLPRGSGLSAEKLFRAAYLPK